MNVREILCAFLDILNRLVWITAEPVDRWGVETLTIVAWALHLEQG